LRCKIGELCNSVSVTFDKSKEHVILVNTSDVFDGKVLNHQYVQNKKLKGQFKKTFKKNDILYSEIRPKHKRFAYIDFDARDYVASTKLMVLRPNEKVYNKFLYQIMRSDSIINELQDLAETRSGTFPQITFTELSRLEVHIPSLERQKKIVDIITLFDDKIALNKQMNAKLEEMVEAIFKFWFIDFEPFDGEMPQDWIIAHLTNIAQYRNGLAMQKYRPDSGEKGLPVLKIKELRQGFFDVYSDLCSEKINSDYLIDDGDVIFSWSGTLLVDFWTGGTGGLNQHLFKVTSTEYNKWFYYLWTKYYLHEFVRIAEAKATTMGHIKRTDLEKAKVVIPSSKYYNMLENLFSPLFDQIIKNRIENRKLSELRDSLLPRLMSGEISFNQ